MTASVRGLILLRPSLTIHTTTCTIQSKARVSERSEAIRREEERTNLLPSVLVPGLTLALGAEVIDVLHATSKRSEEELVVLVVLSRQREGEVSDHLEYLHEPRDCKLTMVKTMKSSVFRTSS
jgi:hypothetical protein